MKNKIKMYNHNQLCVGEKHVIGFPVILRSNAASAPLLPPLHAGATLRCVTWLVVHKSGVLRQHRSRASAGVSARIEGSLSL